MGIPRGVIAGGAAVLLAACSSAPAAQAPTPSAASTGPVLEGTPVPDSHRECLSTLPLDVRIGQTMLVTTTDLDRVRGWLHDGLIAGVLANGRLDPGTATALRDITEGTRYGALLAADEEGGPVQRYRDVIGAIPSAQRQATTMSPAEVQRLYARHGRALARLGVDLVLAPVADVGHGPGIGPRAYADDPRVVSDYAGAAARGLSEAGVLPVLKHFPGHGSSTGDSHYELVEGPGIAQLRAVDLLPYREIADSVEVAVMVGHTTIPGFSDEPSSQSPETIEGLLRGELGFSGLVVSDALGMAASGKPSQGDALVGFLRAGGDLGIVGPGGSVEGRRAVHAALRDGRLPEPRLDEAAAAVLAAKGIDPCGLAPATAPAVQDSGVPTDAPVINPTEEP